MPTTGWTIKTRVCHEPSLRRWPRLQIDVALRVGASAERTYAIVLAGVPRVSCSGSARAMASERERTTDA